MTKRSTFLMAALLAPLVLGATDLSAAPCSAIDAIALKSIAKVLQVEERSLTAETKLSGPFGLTEKHEEQLTSELERNLKFSEDAWDEDVEWKVIEDILKEVRGITACTSN